jgi:hypothetical protein
MTPLAISLWALLLVVQNASFTWVSRARNSGSDWYHAVAAVFSNGVWFAAFFFTFEGITLIRESGDTLLAVSLGAVYIVATVAGSVSSGWFLRTYVERGKRKVGHYEEQGRCEKGLAFAMTLDHQEYIRDRDERERKYD